MDFSNIIAWIPKIAATLLVILGILIVLEIRAMIRKKKASLPQTEKNELDVLQVTKVHFPDTGIKTEIINHSSTPHKINKKLFLGIPFVVIILFVIVHFLTQIPSTQISETPTPMATTTPLSIMIYRFGEAGDIELINQSELNKLSPNTEIVVAILPRSSTKEITFTINGEEIPADISNKTPSGEVYITYTLKPDTTDYHISAVMK